MRGFLMSDIVSVGVRIRERRVGSGLKQAELAEMVGISASYLNLIEHNRRRIAGGLLNRLAQTLKVDASFLSEGAQASLVARLQECAVYHGVPLADDGAAADLAARHPKWAQFMIDLDRKVRQLEQTVDGLSDRLSHDPHLAASLHEVLTTVTAIRSTSSILVDMKDIEPEWQNRFHRNISEDSHRLAEEAQALVGYLDGAATDGAVSGSPWDELDAFLAEQDYHFFGCDLSDDGVGRLVQSSRLTSRSSQVLAKRFLRLYRSDTEQLMDNKFRDAINAHGHDAIAIASALSVPLPMVIRRLAFSPKEWFNVQIGLAACDASGSFFLRKPVTGFHIPRFGSACPLWPLFGALQSPGRAFESVLTHTGREGGTFASVSVAELFSAEIGTHQPTVLSYMLVSQIHDDAALSIKVGAACRVCAIAGCKSRRELSILGEDL
jgi:transcriptional regulator with XRE-family HTH domain